MKKLLLVALVLALPALGSNVPVSSLTPRGAPQATDLIPILPAAATNLLVPGNAPSARC